MRFSTTLYASVTGLAGLAQGAAVLNNRASLACVTDACLVQFTGEHFRDAVSFCSSYIGALPVITTVSSFTTAT
jgi:hypothetical protein